MDGRCDQRKLEWKRRLREPEGWRTSGVEEEEDVEQEEEEEEVVEGGGGHSGV